MWNPSTSDCECNKACTIDKYLDSKNCSCEERQVGKLVLECKDEMFKTPETLLNDKKKTRKKIALFTRFHWQLYACHYRYCFYWLLLLLHKRLD